VSLVAHQEDRKETLDAAWPTGKEQRQTMTGGLDPNLAEASHSGESNGQEDKGNAWKKQRSGVLET
jgi:hypothetical protein